MNQAYDERSASVFVFTFKDGLLSAVAHDLKLRFERFRIEVDGSSVKATFDTTSLRVMSAVPDSMPRAFHSEIEKNIEREVLHPHQFPEATFVSTSVTDTEIVGALTLHGVTREVRVTRDGKKGSVRIDQRDFGIKPFSAMMGTLKIKAEVHVTFEPT